MRDWALTVFCWDGLLPVAVIFIPKLISLLFAGRQGSKELTFVIVPIVAFLVRYMIGMRRFRSCRTYWWQFVLFFVAILMLFMLEAFLVLMSLVQNGPPDGFWLFWFSLYGVYLLIMAVALFPSLVRQSENT